MIFDKFSVKSVCADDPGAYDSLHDCLLLNCSKLVLSGESVSIVDSVVDDDAVESAANLREAVPRNRVVCVAMDLL